MKSDGVEEETEVVKMQKKRSSNIRLCNKIYYLKIFDFYRF